jgi:hypothetical protein
MGNVLEKELIEKYMELRRNNLVESKRFYFREIMPKIRQALETTENHVRLAGQEFETLVSLMGFSPETTVICTLILRPRKLVVVYSREANDLFDLAMRYLLDNNILTLPNIKYSEVDSFDPADIYKRLSELIPRQGTRVFDVTGGTKLMSATAGYLAWEHGFSLCYLDGQWDPKIGAAGLEQSSQLRLYNNPSEQQGYEIRGHGTELYHHGNFVAARKAFEEARHRITDSAFEHLGIALCNCYSSLADLDRAQLSKDLDELRRTLAFGNVRNLYHGRLEMERHLSALDRIATSSQPGQVDQMALAAVFLELAEVYQRQERHDFASLLIYRSMEALVEMGLLKVNPTFKMDDPDYTLLGDPSTLAAKSDSLQKKARGLPPTVGLQAGFTLLMVLEKVNVEAFGKLRPEEVVRKVGGYASKRNKSVLAHGTSTLTREDSHGLLSAASTLATAILGEEAAQFDRLRYDLRPRQLSLVKP